MPGIDDAWRTRIPQGWIQFQDGSWGPPNPTSPIDQGWQTRVPGQPAQLPGATPAAPVGSTFNPTSGAGPNVGSITPPPGTTTLNSTGPDIIPPQGSNVGTGKQVGPWTNPSNDAVIGPGSAAGAFDPWSLLNKFGLPGIAAGGIMHTTPTAPPSMDEWPSSQPLGPVGEHSGHPDAGTSSPFVQPQHPSTMRFPSWPTPPAPTRTLGEIGPENIGNQNWQPPLSPVRPTARATAPRATPKGGRIDPATVNLGTGSPFVQIDRPNMDPAGGQRGGGPAQMSALDLSKLFGGGAPPGPLANVPAAAAQPVSATRRVQAPLGVGPYQQGMRPDYTDIYNARARSGYQ